MLIYFYFLQVQPLFEKADAKNKLLRSVAGGGVESLNQLQARWDKFELMMESHQLMVKEQVILLTLVFQDSSVHAFKVNSSSPRLFTYSLIQMIKILLG